MEEENKRETRQRSRSKTPLTLRSSVDRDVGIDGDKKKSPTKKNPTVETITEESPAPVAQRATRTKRITTTKVISSDATEIPHEAVKINKDTAALIANSVAVVPSAIAASEQTITKTTVVTTKTVRGGFEKINNESTTSNTIKSTRAATREADQNESNVLLERNLKLKTSTPRSNNTSAYPNFTEINTTNGNNLDEHIPFKEYKEAGEYWNKFPKTDFTYSRLSQHRREIKPGVIAMPNMSRRSLENHHDRVTSMIRRDPAQASFFRSRYESLSALRKRAVDSYYDSQDETDISQYGKNGGSFYAATKTKSWLRRLITVITTFFSTVYYRTTNVFRRKHVDSVYYSRYGQEQRGLFSKIWHGISSSVLTVFYYIYLGISSVLFLDSWLLQSSNASGGKKKGFLIGLLILLPLLLLGGTYYYLDKPAPIPNININISLDQIIDPQLIENVKTIGFEKYNNVVNISSDYLLYLKTVVHNSANEAKKIWSENFSY